MRIDLAKADLKLQLDPGAGGAVSGLYHGDLEILRPAPERLGPAFDPLAYSAFPMVPFVGRIHHGQIVIDDRKHQLPANLPPEPHAIHGHGWRAAWKVETATSNFARLVYEHSADAWPWTYRAEQSFLLLEDALKVDLSVTNLAVSPMPAGLGWHPYFARDKAHLSLPTTQIWTPDPMTGENRPSLVPGDADLSSGSEVATLNLDTTYSLGPGAFELQWPTHSVTITHDPIFTHATVFVPPGATYFCVEPITHAPNAINSTLPADITGFRVLAPNETLSGSITLSIRR